jgi:hypothetical protein
MAGNAAYDWNAFDAWDYLAHNYVTLREDDRRILELTGDFFTAQGIDPGSSAVDVGTGTNLYPALAMLPFCTKVSLLDYSTANIDWLNREVVDYSQTWDDFWGVLTHREPYRALGDPRAALRRRAVVQRWNILQDGTRQQWDLGTMFFVAESITTEPAEFRLSVRDFCALLKPGAAFAVTFMENSRGYEVGGRMFPAVRIGEDDVRSAFTGLCNVLEVYHPDAGVKPLREGYTGMILVHGTVK